MPTNQSSPWGGAKLRACSNAGSPTAPTSVDTHAKAVLPNKVPFSSTSLELTKRKDQAKSLPSYVASSASTLRQTTVAPSRLSVWESGDGIKTLSQSSTVPQRCDGFEILNKSQVAALKQPGNSLTEINASSSISKKECQVESDIQLQNYTWLQTSQAGNGLVMSRCQAAVGDALLGLDPLMSVCQDLFFKGQPPAQQNDNVMVSIHVPSVFLLIKTDFGWIWGLDLLLFMYTYCLHLHIWPLHVFVFLGWGCRLFLFATSASSMPYSLWTSGGHIGKGCLRPW